MGLQQGLVKWFVGVLFLGTLLLCNADVHHYDFFVQESNFTKMCNTTTLLVVNDSYPGPDIRFRRGDTVFVNVHNQGNDGFTIHWHGVKQPRNPRFNGLEFITQFVLSEEIGTLWWHAHSDWTRGSVHDETYPFPTPDAEQTIILESWYNGYYKQIIDQALATGDPPRLPDAYAINGHLRDTYGCPNTIFRMEVDYEKTYLLRIINAAMNEQQFFTITNHTVIVVAQDASYVRRFKSDYILISPGLTMDVLVSANRNVGLYYMATRPFSDSAALNSRGGLNASLIQLPAMDDTDAMLNFVSRIRNTNVTQNMPKNVPVDTDINRRVYIAVAVNRLPCNTSKCVVSERIVSSLNNVSFVSPRIDILQAYYRNISCVFTQDFPLNPSEFYDFTGQLTGFNSGTEYRTRAIVVNYGEAVKIVLHPIHFHGYSFYWVGAGLGNFNNETDPSTYNLIDPPLINTVHVPCRGWVALRFFANNPGKFSVRKSKIKRTLIVRNGSTIETSIRRPRPSTIPRCHGT
ncbi:hypothetical protein GOBAR_AA22849 [Gossypium barbadense]|uniref:laccase n=1 Tax=Gossypium barbadense TaxID=3634 RepID=A0A2P5X385_GOSBA|nr:hypothetical protein GOBAR_AA22849 [Gossypium barbadense]